MERKTIAVLLPGEVYRELRYLSYQTGDPMSRLVRRAISAFLKDVKCSKQVKEN